MDVEGCAPSDFAGDLMGDLNSRRGRSAGMDTRTGMMVIKAQVPMAGLLTYEPHLTSATGGRGSYAMEHSHHTTRSSRTIVGNPGTGKGASSNPVPTRFPSFRSFVIVSPDRMTSATRRITCGRQATARVRRAARQVHALVRRHVRCPHSATSCRGGPK
jgi:translation elongation factor EF-G